MCRLLVTAILFFLVSGQAFGSHIFGGELYYKHLSGSTYEVNLALYGDCNGASFPGLYSLMPRINVLKNSISIAQLSLSLDNSVNDEITPVCPLYKDSTQCSNSSYKIIGVKRFIYRDTIALPDNTPNYKFVFDGGANNAGRTNNITNIVNINASLIYLEAELDNSLPNSSPRFTTVPTPFYCVNIQQEYNQGAIDSDNDSLIFELANALDAGGFPAIYAPGYTASIPIETSGQFEFNNLNGQMKFTPTIVQNSVVVNKVYEYRNGNIVGSSMREMTFIVIDNCNNAPVSSKLDTNNIVGGVWTSGNVLNVCEGTESVRFVMDFYDVDGDTVDVSVLGTPQDANLSINGNGTLFPSMDFQWDASNMQPGNYTFFVTVKDRHCPVSSSQTIGMTIRVVAANQTAHEVIRPTNCTHKAGLKFLIQGGLKPRTFTLRQGTIILRTFTDTADSFIDSLRAGSYTLDIVSKDLLCTSSYEFSVVDSGIFPFDPLFNNNIVCYGAVATALTAIGYPGATLRWYSSEGVLLAEPPVPNTMSDVPQTWQLSQLYGVCESRMKSIIVTVAVNPEVKLLFDTGNVCIGEKIKLSAFGADEFIWLPSDLLFYEPDSTPFIRIYEPVNYTVIGRNKTGCMDTLSFSYSNIDQCCTFSYPSAFTPNGDKRNDMWRPIMYGNHLTYELNIYNRWGMRLFHSFIPNEGWDGTYEGKPQDIGTYFYLLKAKCVAGKEEVHKGDLLLLR